MRQDETFKSRTAGWLLMTLLVIAVSLGSGVPVAFGASSLDLLDAANVRVDGASAFDQLGNAIAGAGDLNGDGRDDVIVGVDLADHNSRTNSGSAFVIFGQATPSTIDLAALDAAAGFRIDGAAENDRAGTAVGGAGDVNGDGIDDVVVGAKGAANNSRPSSGSVYVIFGGGVGNVDLSEWTGNPLEQGFRIDGAEEGDDVGAAVSMAGDVNADGRGDVIVGDPSGGSAGGAWVIFGADDPLTADIDLDSLDLSRGFHIGGATAGDQAGYAVSSAGDLNSDGRDDVVVGAPGAGNTGSAYVIYGRLDGDAADVELSAMTPAEGIRIVGAGDGHGAGRSVGGGGDVNGDGRDDVIVGALSAGNNDRHLSGSGYVIFGTAEPCQRRPRRADSRPGLPHRRRRRDRPGGPGDRRRG